MYHAVTDFTNQNAVGAEIIRRIAEEAARQLQAIPSRGQTQNRLMLLLVRQAGHVLFIDIRRISDDQIVL